MEMQIKRAIGLVLLGVSFSSFAVVCPTEKFIALHTQNAHERDEIPASNSEFGSMTIFVNRVSSLTPIWTSVLLKAGSITCAYNGGGIRAVKTFSPQLLTVIPTNKEAPGWKLLADSDLCSFPGVRETCNFCPSALNVCAPAGTPLPQ